MAGTRRGESTSSSLLTKGPMLSATATCSRWQAGSLRAHLLERSARSRKTGFGSDPARARVKGAIGFDETWRLFVNVTAEELRGSAGLGKRRTLEKDP